MSAFKITLFICLLFIAKAKIAQRENAFNLSLSLSKSIFDNYYCGDVDGFPHFKLQYNSTCKNTTSQQIFDRDFWVDGTALSTFFYLYNFINETNSSIPPSFQKEVSLLIKDWNYTQIRNILLWDKLNKTDRYGVGNDDRLWYAISFMQIQNIIGVHNNNQKFYELASEIYEFVTVAFENKICGGGVFWDIEKSYKNSITNHLYIDLAVYLHEFTQNNHYMEQAKAIADWELNVVKLQDKSDFLFYDGAYNHKVCHWLNKDKWTYNQGVFMRGYLALSSFFNDATYEQRVYETVFSLTSMKYNLFKTPKPNSLQFLPYHTDPNFIILLEYGNTLFSETRATFKGIFMRYLGSTYTHVSKQNSKQSLLVKKSIEKYVEDNVNYVYSLVDSNNSYPFYWNQNVSLSNQTFTSGTTVAVLDLFTLYNLISKTQISQQN